MAVPAAYLTSTKNVPAIFDAVRRASVPERFTYEFLKQLGFASSTDRPTIPVLKALGFLDDSNRPTQRYRHFKDAAQSSRVLAEGIRDAYSDLFAIETKAHAKSATELQGLFGRLSDKGEAVTKKMATTFKALSALADFETPLGTDEGSPADNEPDDDIAGTNGTATADIAVTPTGPTTALQLRHDIHIHLPESTNVAVYDAIFRSVRANLLS